MKNLINYYYNIIINEYKKRDNKFIFEYQGNKFEFVLFEGDLNYFYKIYSILFSNKIYTNQVLLNKDNSVFTWYENKPYILLKQLKNADFKISFQDVLNYDVMISDSTKVDWKNLWQSKIDYYEYQINQLGFKHKKIKESFSYYIGLAETAILILNFVDIENVGTNICHKRINCDEKFEEFCNPTNIVIDNITRDIAEYIKINLLNEKINIETALEYINSVNFGNDEMLLLLARLLYPSYYFDIYDIVMQEKIGEDVLDYYIKKNVYYETFLKNLYMKAKFNYKIPQIEWLEINLS